MTTEQIGFHKGSLATLAKEREELVKIVKITEQLMEAHVKALKELGVDLEAEAKKAQEKNTERKDLDERIA
jgi:thiaminase